ncbi:flagellar brake protein [Nitrincola tapanii]|uniref:HD-GYP domain-containing protein n=1 Tax=Nitrincola tapanii TaxID=1708751 RepID=A0A5A9W223_9GAMM|nr:flagellar brake protein [Nitrincola tapanii]KAA0874776.1 hypothetical protein E1H14_08150 [Nitrincola tapanii]
MDKPELEIVSNTKPEPEGERIQAKREISSMLKQVSERITALTLEPADTPYSLTAYLNEVNLEEGYLAFDPPLPENRRHLLANRLVTLITRHNGCRLTCPDLTLTSHVEANGELQYRASWPEEVFYLQRRRAYRAPVRPLLDIIAHLQNEVTEKMTGRLRDLSVEGCRLEFSGQLPAGEAVLTQPLSLLLCFPNGESFELKLQPLRLEYLADKNLSYLGCQFDDPSAHQRQQLNRVVGDLQRDFIHFSRQGTLEGTPTLFIPQRQTILAEMKPDLEATEQAATTETNAEKAPPSPEATKKSRTQAPVQPQRAYDAGIIAIKHLAVKFRAGQTLPLNEALDATDQLLRAWQEDRQALLIQRFRRDRQSPLFDHSLSVALLLVDVVARQYPDQVQSPTLTGLILGGFCHDLAYSLLPGGLTYQTGLAAEEEKQALRKAHQRLVEALKECRDITPEALRIVTESHELLDGEGWPQGLAGDHLSKIGKLSACINALDRFSHIEKKGYLIYHPLAGLRHLLQQPEKYHSGSVKFLWRQLGKYPLGSLVKLSDQSLALVMRQDEDGLPLHLRRVYQLDQHTHLPPRDLYLPESGLEILGSSHPQLYDLDLDLLRPALRTEH